MKLFGKVNPKISFYFNLCLFGAIFCFGLSACKTSSDSFTSKAWHDMNSKYNSVWIAREAIKEVERDLFKNRTDNYNRVLDVMVNTDTNKFKAHDEAMKKAIKKSANVPNWHDNSGWLDYSYILIGQSRFYLREFEDAINTFKYVNTRGDAEDYRNRALIELMRTYIQLKDYKGARAALNALRKRKMEKEELEEFLLVRGHFFREQEDFIETAKSLGSAVKIMTKGEKRGRLHFILGQIYQKLEREALAYQNYKKVLKNNPSYELSFYTRLYMAQVSRLNKGSDVKKIERYFKKLLKDEKNLEYQDKIYYEMGLFALRQGNVDKAISNLNESIIVSTKNPIQKAYSYLKLGEIYYADLEEYETAKVYYDSVLINLPKNVENYKEIETRQKTLSQFVEQISAYRTQDSLQRLAKIPEPQRGDYITSMLKLEEAKKQDKQDSVTQALSKRERLRKRIQTAPTPVNPNASRWYFDNPEAIRLGLQAFKDRWGNNRPLVDNWRRSAVVKRIIDTVKVEAVKPPNPDSLRKEQILKRVEARKKDIYDALPLTEKQVKASNRMIEDAAFELGKIYKFKLDEPDNAIKFFEILLERFPETKYTPEAMYYLYQLHFDKGDKVAAGRYKQILVDKFPKSSFTLRLQDPKWYEKVLANQGLVDSTYKQAYHLFEVTRYGESLALVQDIEDNYPENIIPDKLAFLRNLILIKQGQDKATYKANLQSFIDEYPDSDLIDLANSLLNK